MVLNKLFKNRNLTKVLNLLLPVTQNTTMLMTNNTTVFIYTIANIPTETTFNSVIITSLTNSNIIGAKQAISKY